MQASDRPSFYPALLPQRCHPSPIAISGGITVHRLTHSSNQLLPYPPATMVSIDVQKTRLVSLSRGEWGQSATNGSRIDGYQGMIQGVANSKSISVTHPSPETR